MPKPLSKSRLYDVIHRELVKQVPGEKARQKINTSDLTVAVWDELVKRELVED